MNGLTKRDYEEIGNLVDEKLDNRFKGYPTGEDIQRLMVNIDKMMQTISGKEEEDLVHKVRHEANEDDLINLKQRMVILEKKLGVGKLAISN